VLLEELDEHHSLSPEITGGDIDASWQTANQAGEETVGGSVPTPDQDIVDELGDAAGLTYRDDEPLDYDKVRDRDRNRWELNPASALDNNELSGEDLDDEDLEDEDLDELDEEDDEGLEDEESEGDELDDEDLEDEDLEDEELDDEDDEEYIDAELEEDEDA
jgi:hypothetical protein